MKKIISGLITLSVVAFTTEQNVMQGCVETKLNNKTSIFSCPTGDFLATFKLDNGKRANYEAPIIEKIGESKKIIQNINKP
jgi:hypothetical protein